ncbi:MAG: hypothetical protein HY819_02855 [Acidobacteria bacterium]|nr:hypothetical protein [Acidobacteriota bacterium]
MVTIKRILFHMAILSLSLLLAVMPLSTFAQMKNSSSKKAPKPSQQQITIKAKTATKRQEIEKKIVTKKPYPYSKYYPVSLMEMDRVQERFLQNNIGVIEKFHIKDHYVEFDKFGFVEFLYVPDPSIPINQNRVGTEFTAEEIKKWREFLIKNAEFFGIDDFKNFQLKFSAKEQSLQAIQVINGIKPNLLEEYYPSTSHMQCDNWDVKIELFPINIKKTICSNSGCVYIYNHFWPKAYLPTKAKVPVEYVVNRVVGKQYKAVETRRYANQGDEIESVERIIHTVTIEKDDIKVLLRPVLVLSFAMLSQRNTVYGRYFELRLIYSITFARDRNKKPNSFNGQLFWYDEFTRSIDAINGDMIAGD